MSDIALIIALILTFIMGIIEFVFSLVVGSIMLIIAIPLFIINSLKGK